MNKKYCTDCHTYKPYDAFHRSHTRRDGRQQVCRECKNFRYRKEAVSEHKQQQYKQHNQKRIDRWREYINRVKSELQCAHCGESDSIALDFHHENKNKEVKISDMNRFGFTETNIQWLHEEINKCTVLCANCHRKEHRRLRE